MTDNQALVAYRYSVADIDRWPADVIKIFAQHLRKETESK